jgi:hypothetical protein
MEKSQRGKSVGTNSVLGRVNSGSDVPLLGRLAGPLGPHAKGEGEAG